MGDSRSAAEYEATHRSSAAELVAIEMLCLAWENSLPERDLGTASVRAMLVRAIHNNRGLYLDSPQQMETVRSVFCHLCRRFRPGFLRDCLPSRGNEANCVLVQAVNCLDAEVHTRNVDERLVGYPRGV